MGYESFQSGYIDTHFNVYGRDQITFPTQMLGKAINRIVKIEIRLNLIGFSKVIH